MYLHIGEDILVKTKDIVAILDKQLLNHSSMMEEFFKQAGNSEVMSKGSIKSIIVTKEQLFFSPLSSSTLMKRSTQHPFEESVTVNR
ncbi:extracellular matrix regulator RemB [Peribacillus acanthi]|uniref:extracellular matrix regulator RemB n=1 Tax=Peribacillus acanthi TaxID=2171554 RepID=UPI000D3E5134|nr:extracellular matrix/biofilm biosynthesis regulator RemA family protein [Peribacillus acanthi]